MNRNDEWPVFQLNKSRFDQNNFYGRWRHFLDVIDPSTLLIRKKEQEHSIELLKNFESNNLPSSITNKDLWKAQKIKQAIFHPDTGEKIMMPFRMSGFVPFGAPIVVGLLVPNQTLPMVVFWQWLNQTHNACVNYANRNATKPTPLSRFLYGYTGAVTTAVSIALSLQVLIKKSANLSPTKKALIQRFVPFPAVAVASTMNLVLMRNNELIEGIEVFDSDNKVVGTSVIAAKKALMETAITRMILPAPILIIPPLLMSILEKRKFLAKNPSLILPCNAFITTLTFGIALPIAIALFPQISSIKKIKLEQEVQEGTNEHTLFYNKGL